MKKPWDFAVLKERLLAAGLDTELVGKLLAVIQPLRSALEGVANKALPIVLAWARESLELSSNWFQRQAIKLGWGVIEKFCKDLIDKIDGK